MMSANLKFGDICKCIYLIELEILDTINTVMSVSYRSLHLEIDNEVEIS